MRCAPLTSPPAPLRIVGESAAGHGYGARAKPGRGRAHLHRRAGPARAPTRYLLQEDAVVADGALTPRRAARPAYSRQLASISAKAQVALFAGARLGPAELALAAAMNHAAIPVARRPRVAIIASGDELVPPGAEPGPSQIISCNNLAVAAIAEDAGAEVIDLGIFRDDLAELERGIGLAREARADVLVTLGGASVGDHDLLRPALARQGMSLDFWKIAMRPGKPLIHGALGDMRILGLPGNPVASFVCALVFLAPLLRALQGDPDADADRTELAIAGADLPANKGRRDYMRARLAPGRKWPPRRDAAAAAGFFAARPSWRNRKRC